MAVGAFVSHQPTGAFDLSLTSSAGTLDAPASRTTRQTPSNAARCMTPLLGRVQRPVLALVLQRAGRREPERVARVRRPCVHPLRPADAMSEFRAGWPVQLLANNV